MNKDTIINQTLEPKDINEFAKEGVALYHHYEEIKDEITMEYIAVRLNTMYSQKKERPNLIGFLEDREEIDMMGEYARNLVQKRVGKPAIFQLVGSFILIIVWYQLMANVFKFDATTSMVVTIIVMVVFNYLYVTISGNRMITKTNQLYKTKVDPKLIKYFNYYMD